MGLFKTFLGRRTTERTSGKTLPRAAAEHVPGARPRRLDPPRLSSKASAPRRSPKGDGTKSSGPARWKAPTGSHARPLPVYHGSGYFGAVHEPNPSSSEMFDRKEMQAAFERWGESTPIEVQQDVERRVRDDEILRRRGESYDHHRAQRVDDHDKEYYEALSRAHGQTQINSPIVSHFRVTAKLRLKKLARQTRKG